MQAGLKFNGCPTQPDPILESRAVYPAEKTQQLINDFGGTGIKAPGSKVHIPGAAGYQEIVNFGEFIGYDVNLDTGVKTVTTWGKIHYAKDGVHVVPYLPMGN